MCVPVCLLRHKLHWLTVAVGAAVLLARVVELGEVAVLDETEPDGDLAPAAGDEDLVFSCSSFLMEMEPDVEAGVGVDEDAFWPPPPPMEGNTIRMLDPGLPAAGCCGTFGCRPTAFATALMSEALGKVTEPLEGIGVVEPFVLLLLLVFIAAEWAASEPLLDCCWANSVLWMIFTWAVMLSLRVNSLKQYGQGYTLTLRLCDVT